MASQAMQSLFLPNLDALRLAITSEILPREMTSSPIRAGQDASGAYWIQPQSSLPPEILAPLSRLGIRWQNQILNFPFQEWINWFCLFPLQEIGKPLTPPNRTLFRLALPYLAQICQTPQYRQGGCRFQIFEDHAYVVWEGRWPSWIAVTDPEHCQIYVTETHPRVWLPWGWLHPLSAWLTPIDGNWLLLNPNPPWFSIPEDFPHQPQAKFPSQVRVLAEPIANQFAKITLPLQFSRCPVGNEWKRILWWYPAADQQALHGLKECDEQTLHDYSACQVPQPWGGGWLFTSKTKPWPPTAVTAHCRTLIESAASGVFLPLAEHLSLAQTSTALKRVFVNTKAADSLIVLPNDDSTVEVWPFALSTMRPLMDWIQYLVPKRVEHRHEPLASSFQAFQPFEMERVSSSPTLDQAQLTQRKVLTKKVNKPSSGPGIWGWAKQILQRSRSSNSSARSKSGLHAATTWPALKDRDKAQLQGQERMARRDRLETAIALQKNEDPVAQRLQQWQSLAQYYAENGHNRDAILCYINAIWETPEPRLDWVIDWLHLEAKRNRVTVEQLRWPAILRRPPTLDWARLLCAYLVHLAAVAPNEKRLVSYAVEGAEILEKFEADLPLRMVWLTYQALAKLFGNDTLILARCWDRLQSRLAHTGIAMDLDAPTFLRFYGTSTPTKAMAAREWLLRQRDPIHRWLAKHDSSQSILQAGLGFNLLTTTAYADLILACGLARLGDRAKAREYLQSAKNTLLQARHNKYGDNVHARLIHVFEQALRAMQEGQAIPHPQLQAAGKLQRIEEYTVAKLQNTLQIVRGEAISHSYLPPELQNLLLTMGWDSPATRWLQTVDCTPDGLSSWGTWLDEAQLSQQPDQLCQVVMIGLYAAHALPIPLVERLLRQVPLVIGWLETHQSDSHSPRQTQTRELAKKYLLQATLAAANNPAYSDAFEDLVDSFLEQSWALDRPLANWMFEHLYLWDSVLKKMELTNCRIRLTERFSRYDAPANSLAQSVILESNRGQEDRALALLNQMRDRLFVQGLANIRERTDFALEYTRLLEYAPQRLAHGRLEEVFLRLEAIRTDSATAKYFALQPLKLIDQALHSAIGSELAIGPKVRDWLNQDELRIRQVLQRDYQTILHDAECVSENLAKNSRFPRL